MSSCAKAIDPLRLQRYSTAALAAATGMSVRAINAAKHTGSVRRTSWHKLVAAMGTLHPLPKGYKQQQARDKTGRFI